MWTLKRSVLLISPISFITNFIQETVRPYFSSVFLVTSVSEALEYLRNQNVPDLIIGAYILKDGTLFEFIEACKVEGIKCPPILMVTSEEDEVVIKRALESGVLEVINKKVLKEKLRDFIHEFVSSIDIRKLKGKMVCVEDSKVYTEFISKALRETDIRLFTFDKAEDAYEFLKKEGGNILVVDFLLKGDYSGLDLIRMVRREPELSLLPIIVMTGFDDMNRRMEFFKAGADDYLIKPFSGQEFLVKVRNHLQKYGALRELEEQLKQIREESFKDPLTGAYNRKVLEFVEKEVHYAKRNNKPFSIVLFDIDNFKYINDRYGHAVGDSVLSKFSKLIHGCIRKSDYFIRYGGEEFLLAMPGANSASAKKKADNIRKALEELDFGELRVTVSAGVACLPKNKNIELKELIERADKALYKAKNSGKNRVEVYSEDTECISDKD